MYYIHVRVLTENELISLHLSQLKFYGPIWEGKTKIGGMPLVTHVLRPWYILLPTVLCVYYTRTYCVLLVKWNFQMARNTSTCKAQ